MPFQLYTPTNDDIIKWVGDTSFSRAHGYTGDMLADLKYSRNLLKCKCFGSEKLPYKVKVTLNSTNILSSKCSCFIGDDGKCKHVAALLVAWRDERENFETD